MEGMWDGREGRKVGGLTIASGKGGYVSCVLLSLAFNFHMGVAMELVCDARFEAVLRPIMVGRHERMRGQERLVAFSIVLYYTASCSIVHTYTSCSLPATPCSHDDLCACTVDTCLSGLSSPVSFPLSAQREGLSLVNSNQLLHRVNSLLSTPYPLPCAAAVLMIDQAVPIQQ